MIGLITSRLSKVPSENVRKDSTRDSADRDHAFRHRFPSRYSGWGAHENLKGKTRMGLGSTRLVVSTGAGSTRLRVALMSTTSGKPAKKSPGRSGARPIARIRPACAWRCQKDTTSGNLRRKSPGRTGAEFIEGTTTKLTQRLIPVVAQEPHMAAKRHLLKSPQTKKPRRSGAKVMPNTCARSAYPAAAAVRNAGTTRPPQPRHHGATWVRGQRGRSQRYGWK